MKKILVLGSGGSPGINFIKALRLASEKIYIVGADINKYHLEMTPVDKKYHLPYEKNKTREYVARINKIVALEKINFIHAQPDQEVKVLSDFRNILKAKVFLPSKKAIHICQNKWLTFHELSKHQVPVAQTFQVKNFLNLKKIFKKNKKTLWIRASHGAGGKGSLPVSEYNHARMWIEYWLDHGLKISDFLASEYLPGREVSWLSLWKDGRLICSQQKERFEWVQANISPSRVGGTTAIQKTVHYRKVNEICTKTVKAVDEVPQGIYVVDTKENEKGIPCVTELNIGRFFTTSLFFAQAGVNFPLIYLHLGLDLPIPKVAKYNCLPENIFWIRVPDGGPVMVRNEKWSSKTL